MTDVPTTPRKPMPEMRRLRIWERHGGVCVLCGLKIDGTKGKWTIEHLRALGLGGEDTDENCGPAHEDCRRAKDKIDVPAIAKAKRMKARHLGIKRSSRPIPGSKASGWRKPFNGPPERRY
jgi:5-methylcytosine-specific restriction protein A